MLDFIHNSKIGNYLIKKPSGFIQRNYIFSLFIVISICFIITLILFTNDSDNSHFNRSFTIVDGNKKYNSSNGTDALHYVLTTFSTVGYGDITPISSSAKAWTNFMQFLVIVMTLKLFEYIATGDSTTLNTLINRNRELSEENTKLSQKNTKLSDENTKLENQIVDLRQIISNPNIGKVTNIMFNKNKRKDAIHIDNSNVNTNT